MASVAARFSGLGSDEGAGWEEYIELVFRWRRILALPNNYGTIDGLAHSIVQAAGLLDSFYLAQDFNWSIDSQTFHKILRHLARALQVIMECKHDPHSLSSCKKFNEFSATPVNVDVWRSC